jgi:hypothetical protein
MPLAKGVEQAEDGPSAQPTHAQKLAALRQAGVLTEEEFQDQKRRILGDG